LAIALRPQTPKHIRGDWSHSDTSEPVYGNGATNMVTVQSGLRTRDLSITGYGATNMVGTVQAEFRSRDLPITGLTRLPTALTGPTRPLLLKAVGWGQSPVAAGTERVSRGATLAGFLFNGLAGHLGVPPIPLEWNKAGVTTALALRQPHLAPIHNYTHTLSPPRPLLGRSLLTHFL
jgi:hypothetical protein